MSWQSVWLRVARGWTWLGAVPAVLLILLGSWRPTVTAQSVGSGQHWVSTWATAQQLAQTTPGGPGRGAAAPAATAAGAATTQAPTPSRGGGPPAGVPPTLEDQTVRMVVRSSIGGPRLRVALSNMAGALPLYVGAARVARSAGGDAIETATDRGLTFGGLSSFVVPPGALLVSDPVELSVSPLSDLAVSLHITRDTGLPTTHALGLRTTYISAGNAASQARMPEPSTTFSYLWLSSVDVLAPASSFTVVALGDSITDGYATTRDAVRAWPSLLAKRLATNKSTAHVGVVNQGISGNQVLRNGAGVSALARFDRDVLSRPGVKWVILLEGINDINIRGRVEGPDALTADELIAGYRQIITRAHSHGIRVIGATLTPEEGVPTASERGEGIRQAANQWIRTSGAFDAVIDFDAVIRDPARPIRLRSDFDPGDHIHPNDAGNQAMADAFDLRLFTKP